MNVRYAYLYSINTDTPPSGLDVKQTSNSEDREMEPAGGKPRHHSRKMGNSQMAKFNFHEQYKGPRGPHLDCLTIFTITRDESKRAGVSIHPRVGVTARTIHPKSNTSKAPSKARRARVIAALTEHCQRHPHNAVSAGHLHKLQSA